MGARIAKLEIRIEEALKRATEASAAVDAKIDQLMARLLEEAQSETNQARAARATGN